MYFLWKQGFMTYVVHCTVRKAMKCKKIFDLECALLKVITIDYRCPLKSQLPDRLLSYKISPSIQKCCVLFDVFPHPSKLQDPLKNCWRKIQIFLISTKLLWSRHRQAPPPDWFIASSNENARKVGYVSAYKVRVRFPERPCCAPWASTPRSPRSRGRDKALLVLEVRYDAYVADISIVSIFPGYVTCPENEPICKH